MNVASIVSGRRGARRPGHLTVLLLALVLLVIPRTAWAQDVDLEAIDAWIENLLDDWSTPGLAVGIVHGDSLVFARGYGVRSLGSPQPVDEHTLFAVASNSKAFTAAVLGMLVEDG
ncbi:MAG: beta-lactamase family protein, partial [Gemmatimonadetes bacterium]|nr:beta-lactamase family protein [Gemmatimonadota bacterium]NNK48180.1 beta-lactamase family protein [Gemmatimonadota bacterium]